MNESKNAPKLGLIRTSLSLRSRTRNTSDGRSENVPGTARSPRWQSEEGGRCALMCFSCSSITQLRRETTMRWWATDGQDWTRGGEDDERDTTTRMGGKMTLREAGQHQQNLISK